MDHSFQFRAKKLRPAQTIFRMAFIGSLFGVGTVGIPLLLAGLVSTSNLSLLTRTGAGLWMCFLGLIYGAPGGALLGAVRLLIPRSGCILWIIMSLCGMVYGVFLELLFWHRVEGFLWMLGGTGGILITLLSGTFRQEST